MNSGDLIHEQVVKIRRQIDVQVKFYDKLIDRMKHQSFPDGDELWINGWLVKKALVELNRYLIRLEHSAGAIRDEFNH